MCLGVEGLEPLGELERLPVRQVALCIRPQLVKNAGIFQVPVAHLPEEEGLVDLPAPFCKVGWHPKMSFHVVKYLLYSLC